MVGILSDIGNVRALNEDSVGYHEDIQKKIFVVCDGMGGHNAGEIASSIGVNSCIEYIKALKNLNEPLNEIMVEAVKYSNVEIYKEASKKTELKGMGTTITAALVVEQEMVVANVGDSSCYVLKSDGIHKITKDHSLVQELLDNGNITEQEAKRHPNKNIITRALGTDYSVMVDTFNVNLQDVIKVLLCSDGLTNDVDNNEMYDILIKDDSEAAAKRLVELAKLKGGRDNISVVIFEGECEDGRNDS